MREIVLVTHSEYAKAEDVFRHAPDVTVEPAPREEAELAEAVRQRGARSAIVGIVPYRGPLYEALAATAGSRGAILARFGVGHDSIDKALARQHGIVVTNTPGVLDVSVAELTVWLMGGLARNLARLDAQFRAGQFVPQTGRELCGKTLGLVGYGAIASRVSVMAHFGLGMNVIACDKRPPESIGNPGAMGLSHYTIDVDAVLAEADIISLHLPATAETQRFIDARRLALMKPGALLINTARGAIVDEAALYDALASGRLAGAALDVYQTEPYEPVQADKDLRRLENVLFTPHCGSNTVESNRRMGRAALDNVLHFFAGRFDRLARVDA